MKLNKVLCLYFCCFFCSSVILANPKDVVFSSEFEEYRKKGLVTTVDGVTDAAIKGGKLGVYAYRYRVNYDLCHTTYYEKSLQVWDGWIAMQEYSNKDIRGHIDLIESLSDGCEVGSPCYDLKIKMSSLLKADADELSFKQGYFDTCVKWRDIHPMLLNNGDKAHYLKYTDKVLQGLMSDARKVGFTNFLHLK